MSELRLNTDGHIIKFGADNDVSLTHVADTGLLLNSTMQLQFNDASQNINAPSATVLDINATDEIELNATLIDINGNVEISGTAVTTGVHTFTAVPVFPNNTVETADIQADAITGAKIADDAINSEHYTDGSIDTAHIADGQITTAKLASAVFTGATDIGADIADADLFLMDDGAGGTIRKTAASRLKTYAGGAATMTDLTDVSMDITNFVDSFLLQPNSDGSAPSTGTLSTATGNIGIGKDVFSALTTGDYNVVIGYEAGDAVDGGIDHILIGNNAGGAMTGNSGNICIGKEAGQNLTSNAQVVAIGAGAMQGTGGVVYSTVMIGKDAGGACDANGNTIVGYQAGDALDGTACTTNTLYGDSAGGALTTGHSNTCVGQQAGDVLTTGYDNISLGKLSDPPAVGSTYFCILGNSSTSNLQCNDTSISSLSDERDKAEITNLPSEAGLSFINSLKPRTFYWDRREWYDDETPDGSKIKRTHRKWKANSGKRMGFIAQEVQAAIDSPGNIDYMNEIVSKWDSDKLQFGLGYLMTPLVKAVQELSAENTALAARIKALEDA